MLKIEKVSFVPNMRISDGRGLVSDILADISCPSIVVEIFKRFTGYSNDSDMFSPPHLSTGGFQFIFKNTSSNTRSSR